MIGGGWTSIFHGWISGVARSLTHLPSGYLTVCRGKSPFLIGKPSINGPFSMAMLNSQRVCFISKWPVQDIVGHVHWSGCIWKWGTTHITTWRGKLKCNQRMVAMSQSCSGTKLVATSMPYPLHVWLHTPIKPIFDLYSLVGYIFLFYWTPSQSTIITPKNTHGVLCMSPLHPVVFAD